MEKEICVLIPSYNEARTIAAVITKLKGRGFIIYVVDDGSTDATASIARAEGAVVVQHKANKGKGAALREGFSHILKRGFDRILVMDGDDQHSSGDIDTFINTMDETGADMVIGNRMADTTLMPKSRIIVNHLMSSIISLVAGVKVPDTQCGFRLVKVSALQGLKLTSSNYEIESELTLEAAKKKLKIVSVPIKTVYQGEASRINPFVDTWRFIVFMFRAIWRK